LVAIHEAHSLRRRNEALVIDPAHALEKRRLLLLEPVTGLTGGQAAQRRGDWNIEEEREVGLQVPLDPILKDGKPRERNPSSTPLIGHRGIGEPVTHHPLASIQRREDERTQVLLPPGEHQESFGVGVHGFVQEEIPQPFPEWRSARLTGHQYRLSAPAQRVREPLYMGGLSGPIETL
jgi:hypothetical protein